MRKFGGLMYLLCMLILSSCSDDVCRVDGKMSDFPGETTVYLLRRTGEFTRDTLIQTVMKDGSFRVDIPRDLWGEQKITCFLKLYQKPKLTCCQTMTEEFC